MPPSPFYRYQYGYLIMRTAQRIIPVSYAGSKGSIKHKASHQSQDFGLLFVQNKEERRRAKAFTQPLTLSFIHSFIHSFTTSTMFQKVMQSLRRATVRTIVGTGVVVGTLEVTTHLPSQGRRSDFYHIVSDDVVTPLVRRVLNPEQAHDWAIQCAAQQYAPTHHPSATEQRLDVQQIVWGRTFSNPIGLAAGFDKDGVAMDPLLQLGFGFVEIGSVTLHAQPGNPSPRMFRLLQDEAIINRYGFNSVGGDQVEEHLKEYYQKKHQQREPPSRSWIQTLLFGAPSAAPTPGLVGVNLGKNKTSTTPLEDYQALIRQLGPYPDYLVINVSSPNTPGLRDLQESSSLDALLQGCLQARDELSVHHTTTNTTTTMTKPTPPLLVKLSPDLSNEELQEIAQVLMELNIDGIVLTNTTTERPYHLQSPNKEETGGLSGRPLNERSTECIRLVYAYTKGTIPIIGVGGIWNAHDVYEKLKAGASLVQIYSGMVYQGPGMVSKLRHELAEILLQNGHRRLQDVVGLDHDDLYWQKRQEKLSRNQQTELVFGIDEEERVPKQDEEENVAIDEEERITTKEKEENSKDQSNEGDKDDDSMETMVPSMAPSQADLSNRTSVEEEDD
jgi:dihydroorotate dehydrogenase